jgi:hypothetical protein
MIICALALGAVLLREGRKKVEFRVECALPDPVDILNLDGEIGHRRA